MRILHSSAWHLGISNGANSQGPDHEPFMAWILGWWEELQVDVQVVSVDSFGSLQSRASALRRYYRYLGAVGAAGWPDVVAVGGNPDSDLRLDAPGKVLMEPVGEDRSSARARVGTR